MKNDHSLLFRLASKALKFYLLFLLGLAIAYVLAATLGAFPMVELLMPSLSEFLWRLTVITLCFIVIAVVFESLQH